jgi:hypothetical protein
MIQHSTETRTLWKILSAFTSMPLFNNLFFLLLFYSKLNFRRVPIQCQHQQVRGCIVNYTGSFTRTRLFLQFRVRISNVPTTDRQETNSNQQLKITVYNVTFLELIFKITCLFYMKHRVGSSSSTIGKTRGIGIQRF